MKRSWFLLSLFACVPVLGFWTGTDMRLPLPYHGSSASFRTGERSGEQLSLRLLLPRSRNNILGAIHRHARRQVQLQAHSRPDELLGTSSYTSSGRTTSYAPRRPTWPRPKSKKSKKAIPRTSCSPPRQASFDFCDDALGKMDDSKLGDSIELFRGRQGSPRHGRTDPGRRMGRSLRRCRHVFASERNSCRRVRSRRNRTCRP